MLSRRLGTAALLCAGAAILAAAFVGVVGLLLLWAVASLLGVAGLVGSIVAFMALDGGRRDATVGLTTSLIALLFPLFFVVWLVRDIEWGW